ncbi:MAG TPA: LysR family transcriptional regulator [Amycolatopsis sp.]|nr:LysR family transcriptional regulator [Amycolatopsis sp.]
MELFHLRYFVAVAEELNFSQAARRLHMSASPLSRRIKDLEHELRQKLFDRTTHTVELTPAGLALLPLARDVLDRVGSIPWRLREVTEHGTVFVGFPAGTHPDLRTRLRRLEDDTRGRFHLNRWQGPAAELTEAVKQGRLALALVVLPVSDPALEVVEVASERLGAVVPADRFAGRETVRLTELADLAYVAPAGDDLPASFTEIDASLRAAGVGKRLPAGGGDDDGGDYDDDGNIVRLVSSGVAFSLSTLDRPSRLRAHPTGKVRLLPFENFDPRLPIGLVWRRDRGLPGADLAPLVAAALAAFENTSRHREDT